MKSLNESGVESEEKKEGDTPMKRRCFAILCLIGKIPIHEALCDLGLNINSMPLSLAKKSNRKMISSNDYRVQQLCGPLEDLSPNE